MPAMHPDVANGVGRVADHREFRTTAAPRQASAPLLAVRLTTPEGPFPHDHSRRPRTCPPRRRARHGDRERFSRSAFRFEPNPRQLCAAARRAHRDRSVHHRHVPGGVPADHRRHGYPAGCGSAHDHRDPGRARPGAVAHRIDLRRPGQACAVDRRPGVVHRRVARHRFRPVGRGADRTAFRGGPCCFGRDGGLDGHRARPLPRRAGREGAGGVGPALKSYGALITDPIFMGLALLSGFSLAALFTYVSSATFVFQEWYGLSAQQFALIFASGAVCVTAGTQINGALIGRWAPERILTVGVFAGLATAGSILTVALLGLGLWPLIATLLLTLLVTGILLPAVPVIALEANAHRAGSAAALLGAMQFGVGAAVAPITGLFPEGSPVAMAAVMFAAVTVTVGLLLALRPALKRGVEPVTRLAGSEFSAAELTV